MDALAILVRWAHFLGASLVVGVFALLLWVARPATRGAETETADPFRGLDRGLVTLALWALGLTLATGVLDLARQAMVASGLGAWESLRPAILGTVLGETRFGSVWLVRHALLLLLVLLLLFREGTETAGDWLAVRIEALLLSASSLALVGAAGHAASTTQTPLLSIAVDAVHLVGTGVWLGALVPLALFLRWAARQPAGLVITAAAVQRFSALGLVAVTALVLSGVYNGWAQVGAIPALIATPYGQWLGVKLLLVVALLAVAGLNLLISKPRLAEAARSAPTAAAGAASAAARLRRRVLTEAALGAAILGVVALLGVTTPARHDQVRWPLDFRLAWDATKTLPGVQTRVAVGSQVAVLGLVTVLLALLVRRRRRGLAIVAGALAMALGAALALPSLAVDAHPTTYLRPTAPYAALSIEAGRAQYRSHCVACHGIAGYGDGPSAPGLTPRPADLTAKHAGDHTAGDLFWWLTHGIPGSAMAGFADRLSPETRWDVINFIRLLAASEAARSLGPVASPRGTIVAPDFGYTTGVGDSRALKDMRGQGIVLVVLFTVPASLDRLTQLNELYAGIRLGGGEIVAIPIAAPGGGTSLYQALGDRPIFFPIAVDGAAEAARTYLEFRRDLTEAGQVPEPPLPSHLELLIDRQGYLRARWTPEDGKGWSDPSRLAAEIERLSGEAPLAPIAAEHIH